MEKAKGGWGWGGEAAAAAENPAMTAATREQHAKPWKSFPASSKTFMEFSQHIQHHGGGGEFSLSHSHLLSHHFSTMSNPSSWAVWIEVNRIQWAAYSAVAAIATSKADQ